MMSSAPLVPAWMAEPGMPFLTMEAMSILWQSLSQFRQISKMK
jgi:hypothetical protein